MIPKMFPSTMSKILPPNFNRTKILSVYFEFEKNLGAIFRCYSLGFIFKIQSCGYLTKNILLSQKKKAT